MVEKNCGDCKWLVLQEYGYSNYTVEGTTGSCLLQKHPEEEFDNWYGKGEDLKYAEKCDSFTEGEAIFIDCDQEDHDYRSGKHLIESYSDDPEVIEVAKKNW